MRFVVFKHGSYYPRGGWRDMERTFSAEAEARDFLELESTRDFSERTFYQLVDVEVGKIIYELQVEIG